MSDYDSFENGAESDLGAFEEALEISGYDAVTTTQRGMQQDEFLKESGMTIDTVGEAKKVEEKREKRERNSESGIAAAFEAAHQHIDNHKYTMKFDGKDFEISHGDLKKFMGKEQEHLAKQAKAEKDPKKKAQIQRDMMMMQQLSNHMDQNGALTEEQQKLFEDYIERNPDRKAELIKQLSADNKANSPEQNSQLAELNSTTDKFNHCSKVEPVTIEATEIGLCASNSIASMSGDQGSTEQPQQEKPTQTDSITIANLSSRMDMNINF